jgi:hypothetical protein
MTADDPKANVPPIVARSACSIDPLTATILTIAGEQVAAPRAAAIANPAGGSIVGLESGATLAAILENAAVARPDSKLNEGQKCCPPATAGNFVSLARKRSFD